MPKVQQILQQPAPQGRRAVAGDFGGALGLRQGAQALSEVSRAAEALFEADMESRVTRGVAEASRQLNDLVLEEQQNPDYEGSEERFEQKRQEVLDSFRQELTFGRFKDLFDQRVFGISERSRLQVRENVRAKQLDQIRANTLVSVDEHISMARELPEGKLRDEHVSQAREALRRARESGAFTAAQVAQVQLRLEEQLRAADEVRRAQEAADSIIAEFPSRKERLKAARERYSGDFEDQVVARVKDITAEQEAAEKEARSTHFDAVINRAYSGELTREQALASGLRGRELQTVMGVIDQMQARGAVQTDWNTYFRLRAEASNPGTRDDFAARNIPAEFGDKLAIPQLRELVGMQDAPDADVLDTYSQKVDQALVALGLGQGPASQSTDEARREIAFRRNVEAEKRRREVELKRKLRDDELDQLLDFAIEQVIVDEGFFTSTTRGRFEVVVEDISDIPDAALAVIRNALARKGEPNPSDEQIKTMYRELLIEGIL